MSKSVIITAGGIGKRMQSELPKQFLLIAGKPVLAHTIERFYTYDTNIQILVTLPKDWQSYWQDWCIENNFTIPHRLVEGGLERFHSIQNALILVEGDLLAIHDGVRPLLSKRLIAESFQLAGEKGSALPIVPLKESLRFVDGTQSKALMRKHYFLVQTPQVFQIELIRRAYELTYHDGITDDASLVEEAGFEIHLLNGDEFNTKLTTPMDLRVMQVIYEENKELF